MKSAISISVQGINKQLTYSTGSYDTLFLGDFTQKKAEEILTRLCGIQTYPQHLSGAVCPPNVIITYGELLNSFTVSNKKLQYTETEQACTPTEALQIAKGEVQIDKMSALKQERARIGVIPVRKKHLPPTDVRKLKAESIDTGNAVPQFSLKVWKSHSWFELSRIVPWVLAVFFLFIGLIIAGNPKDSQYAPIPLTLSIAMLFLRFPTEWLGKTIIRMGIDWNTNTVWMKKENKKATFLPDANLILSFQAMVFRSSKINPFFLGGEGQPMYFNKIEWHLPYFRSGSETLWLHYQFRFGVRRDAQRAAIMMNDLLNQEN